MTVVATPVFLWGNGRECHEEVHRDADRLTGDERQFLSDLVSSGKAAAKRITHARILLKADAADGGPAWRDADIALALDIDTRTVERVRERFVERGLEAALSRKPQSRLSRLPVFDGDAEGRRWVRIADLQAETPLETSTVPGPEV